MEETVTRYSVSDHDNRNNEQMYGYLEARIDALKNRLFEVEKENRDLRNQLQRSPNRISSNPAKHVATAA
jgi:DNA-binding transcriptional regulator WhiA